MSAIRCEYEVFGKVQGVFFRKFTKSKADELGIFGWVENTPQGTVRGELEGPATKVASMRQWLALTGSPKCQIEKAEFRNETRVTQRKFKTFEVRRDD